MLRSFLVTILMVISLGASAQLSIRGVVRDAKTNAVLPGATVQLEGAERLSITDDTGHFLFDGLTPGTYSVRTKFIGYADKLETVNLQSNVELIFPLAESFQMTDEVIVYATRANDKTPTTYSTIDKQTIDKQNFGQDLPMLLNWTPSVVTTSDAGAGVGYTGMRIRGSDGTSINVTINGIPFNDAESLGTYWVDVPDVASSVQSMQVQRGVGTSTNGAGAFGASINLQTNTRNDTPYATLINAIGSFGTHRHTVGFGTGLLSKKWEVEGRLSKIASDGFIDRASSDLQSYYFSGGFYEGNTVVKALVFGGKERTYQAWYGVPESRLKGDPEAMEMTASNEGWNDEQIENLLTSNSRTFNPYTYENQVDDYKQDHYQLHFSHRFSDALTANISTHYTKGKGFYEEYRYNDKFKNYGLADVVIGDSVMASSDIIRRRWLDNDFYGVTYSLNYEREKFNLVLGGGWNRYDGDHFGEIVWAQVTTVPTLYQYYLNNGDKRDFNIYMKGNYQVTEKLSAFLDLQYRGITYKTSGIENKQNNFALQADFDFFNPKAGVTFALSNTKQLYASYSIANREPVRNDFVDASFNTKPITPKAETLRNLEVGYRASSDRYTISANYYLMDYRNQLVMTGALNDVGASLRTNVAKSYRTGIELEGLIKISDKLRWNVNVTVSQNKIKDFTEVLTDSGPDWDDYIVVERKYKNTDISFSPAVISGSTLSYLPFKGAEISLLTKYVGKQFLDNTATDARSIDGYIVNDVRLIYVLKPKFIKQIDFSILLNNILDEKYSSNGYTWGYLGGGDEYRENYFYPQAGRNFMAMITLKF